jgi:hypothetical protein
MKHSTSAGVLIFVGVLFFIGISSGKELTNYEVFRAQVDTLSVSIAKILKTWQIKSVSYRSKPGEIEMFVRQGIEERLLEDNFRILQDSISVPQLKVIVPVVKVEYSSPVASHIFASSDVARILQSDYDLEISDSGGVKFAKSYSFVYSDTVKESDISDLESGTYNFLHGRIDQGGFLDTMLQPVLFLAAAAVIVYLFFTLRGS